MLASGVDDSRSARNRARCVQDGTLHWGYDGLLKSGGRHRGPVVCLQSLTWCEPLAYLVDARDPSGLGSVDEPQSSGWRVRRGSVDNRKQVTR